MYSEALNLAYSWHEKYKGIVYVATMNDSDKDNKEFREYSCYIDELPNMLDRLNIKEKSNKYLKIHAYITNNTFKSFKGRTDNLLSYNNFVIDIDLHKNYSTTYSYTVLHNLVTVLKHELKAPIWNITHYTGRGLQLWWCFEQVSNKLVFPYRITLTRIIEEISSILSKHEEFNCINVDSTTTKENGYFRLFNTYNAHAEKDTLAIIEKENRYTLQELIDSVNENLEFEKSNISVKTEVANWNLFYLQNRKRMTLIENLIVDRNKCVGEETRNNYLYVYYNCARGVYSSEMAQQKTKNLNNKFKEPLKNLKYIFDYIDKRYTDNNILKFKNSTLISFFHIIEEEQSKYNFRPANKYDYTQRKQNATRDELRKQKRDEKNDRVVNLYLSGLTQKEVAIESGYCVDTVNRILKKNNINKKQERIKQIQLLKSDNNTQKEVASLLEISIATVKRYWNIENKID